LAFSERLFTVLGFLLALAIVLVVGNTIRLAIAARVDEIRVVKLVGGTNAWVRRPFLYTGLWYGMIGGLLAWLLLILCWLLLRGPVVEMAQLYGSSFSLKPLSAVAALVLLGAAMLLGWLGAWWSVSRHLGEIEP
jgi:cell division transport system permease protein